MKEFSQRFSRAHSKFGWFSFEKNKIYWLFKDIESYNEKPSSVTKGHLANWLIDVFYQIWSVRNKLKQIDTVRWHNLLETDMSVVWWKYKVQNVEINAVYWKLLMVKYICSYSINPFVLNAQFLYPLKTSKNLTIFWCF